MTTNEEDRGGCGQSELLVTVLYGEATPEERERFEAHRRACVACDEEFASLSAVRKQLGGWELEAIPHIRVEVRPGIVERLRRAFAMLPVAARVAAAGACALVVLAALNTEVSVGSGGVTMRAHLLPAAPPPPVATGAQLSEEDVRRIVAERVDASVREQLVAYRADMEAELADLKVQLTSAKSSDDVRRLTVQVSAQQKRIERLQRDLDRTAGYGGSDLFSVVLNPAEPGS
jgi:hypothetical protein